MESLHHQNVALFKNILAALSARWQLRGARLYGNRTRAWGRLRLKLQGQLILHDRVRLDGTVTPVEFSVMQGAVLEIGANTFINYGVSIFSAKSVTIGQDCLIGTYVNITDNQFHQIEPEHRFESPESQPVWIADRVWLGTRVIVLPGVTIGEGSVIGAASVVTRDIPARVVAAGVPARVIREI